MYHDNSGITLTHSFMLYFFILLNDSYGFHIHVLPHGCAHGENTLHPDYTQMFHELYKKHSYYANEKQSLILREISASTKPFSAISSSISHVFSCDIPFLYGRSYVSA